MFKPKLQTWRTQLERMRRSYEKLQRPYFSSVEYEDDLVHFFQDCWHLRDWIAFDPNSPIREKDIVNAVASRPVLEIVGDLATACKHMVREQRNPDGAYVVRNDLTIAIDGSKPIDVVYTIETKDGAHFDEKVLSRNAMEAWNELLKEVGLQQ